MKLVPCMFARLSLAGLLLAAAMPLPAQPRYVNPVWPENAPDPTVIRARDGMYYAYTTQGTAPDGTRCHIQLPESRPGPVGTPGRRPARSPRLGLFDL